ncbi:hypothetical protein GGU11DRAFT_750825 [Lentinula aff. detonsa]|nr:hypothetical protein GGU11DRAFT_750825 [Lentinula aff. detonsa]
MSSNQHHTETAQQRRERLLLAQAERQRIRKEEVAKQEAEFAAEMERLEEEAAWEEEEKRLAEEKRVAEEKRKKLAEERELAEAMRLEDERIAELKRFKEELIIEEERIAEEKKQEKIRIAEAKRREEERVAEAEDAQEQTDAFVKLVEENRMERAKAAKKLAKRRGPTPNTARPVVSVVVPPRALGSKAKNYKSKSVISDDSDEAGVEREVKETPRGTKRKRTIKMIARSVDTPNPVNDFNAEDDGNEEEPPSPSQPRSACTCCVLLGDHASRRSRGKRAKLEDDIYRGPAARVTERKFAGPEIAEQLALIVGQNIELVGIARCLLEVQERIPSIMEGREQQKLKEGEVRGKDEDEDEDEDGEGEEDEEEKGENDEEKRRKEVREGKKRAD